VNVDNAKLRNLAILLLVVLGCLQFGIWFSQTGLRHLKTLDEAAIQQKSENADQALRNEQLEAEVNNLRDELDAVEERARNELGLIAEDETFFLVLEDEQESDGNKNSDEEPEE